MPIITTITLLVLGLLLWVMARFNVKANPTPRKFSHNTLVEVIWTGIPIIILLSIALFSFDLLYKEDVIPDGKQATLTADGSSTAFSVANDFPASRKAKRPEHVQVFLASGAEVKGLASGADYKVEGLGKDTVTVNLASAPAAGDRVVIRLGQSVVGVGENRQIALAPTMTVKAIGFQWGWTYAYPDFGDFEFTSLMQTEDRTTPELYKLEVDNRVIVPVGETVRILTAAKDVIHSWALPNFAVKIDAVPGRINETWIRADRVGVYYGQCSEICGIRHAFMPIAVQVVTRAEFDAWVDSQRALAGLAPMHEDAGEQKFAQAATE
jgi:cytochrome c oxidase subunit 2